MLDCNVPVRRKQNRRLVSVQSLPSKIWGMVVIKTCRAKSGRIIAPMTQARTASSGVVTPPPLQRWLHAVLMLFAELVQGVATTLGMIFNRNHRDWHTADAREDLPQAKSDIHLKEANTTHGVILGLVPRISVGTSRGLSTIPLETKNRDSRHKAENDTVVVAATRTRTPPPNGGGAPRAESATSGFRWGTALTNRTVRTRRNTVPHLTCARCWHLGRGSSPARGGKIPAHA
jgi:hypothetical protein